LTLGEVRLPLGYRTSSTAYLDWFKAWYPIVQVEILDREKPHRFELLGQAIVVWNDGPVENNGNLFQSKKFRKKGSNRIDGIWRAFAEQCRHRQVPLSEG